MIVRRELLAVVLLTRIIAQAFGGPNNAKGVLDLHSDRAEIRQVLLQHTPIGSKAADVVKFITTELERSGASAPKIEDGPATGSVAEGSRRRGVKTVHAYLGQYYDHAEVVFLSAPMIMQKEVSAQWAFDERDRLINIFVNKETGVY